MALRHLVSHAMPLKLLSENLKLHSSYQSFSVFRGLINTQCAFILQSPMISHLDRREYDSHLWQYFHTTCQHNAGHSKWSNIKHIKAANDKLKGQRASQLASQIQAILSKLSVKGFILKNNKISKFWNDS